MEVLKFSGHAMEVEMFSSSTAYPRAPKRTKSLMHAFAYAFSYNQNYSDRA